MALQSQGVYIKRESTAAGATGLVGTATSLCFDATLIRRPSGTPGSFLVDGFTTGMKVWTTSTASSNVSKFYTLKSVAATVMGVCETMTSSTSFTGTLQGIALVAVGEVTQFSAFSGTPSIIDITNLQSTAKEKIVSMPDEGQMTLTVNFNANDAMQNALIADRKARQRRLFSISLTDQTTDSSALPTNVLFYGYPTGFSISGSVDNKIEGQLTIEIDGQTYWSTRTS